MTGSDLLKIADNWDQNSLEHRILQIRNSFSYIFCRVHQSFQLSSQDSSRDPFTIACEDKCMRGMIHLSSRKHGKRGKPADTAHFL